MGLPSALVRAAGRPLVAGLAVLAVVAGGACGGEEQVEVRPPDVPADIVPATVQDGAFAFYRSTLPGVEDAFANAGPNSLAADGQLWELRVGDRLIGVLQLATLMPEVDLHNKEHRDQILRQLMPTAREQITIDDVVVWTTVSQDKFTYVWFGEDMFALLTIKPASDDEIDTEGIVAEVISHALLSPGWKPLYIDEEIEI